MSLFAFDVATRKHRVLLRAKDLIDTKRKLSREEELRPRAAAQAHRRSHELPLGEEKKAIMLLPLGGDVFVRLATGRCGTHAHARGRDRSADLRQGRAGGILARGRAAHGGRGQREATQLTTGAAEDVTRGQSDFIGQEELGEPSGLWWSPDCTRIAYLEVNEGRVAKIPVMGYRQGQPDLMMQRYPRSGSPNPDVRLGVLDIATKKTTWLELPKPMRDAENYLGRVRFSSDSEAIYVQALRRDQRRLGLLRASVHDGKARELLVEEEPRGWSSRKCACCRTLCCGRARRLATVISSWPS